MLALDAPVFAPRLWFATHKSIFASKIMWAGTPLCPFAEGRGCAAWDRDAGRAGSVTSVLGAPCRYKRLSDQRYIRHCRENGFPLPQGHAGQADGAAEADKAHSGGHALVLADNGSSVDEQGAVIKESDYLSASMDEKTVEREFWRTMSQTKFSVQYANDIEGTASGDFGAWDLSQIPTSSRSLLRLLPDLIPGVTTPMLYIGMLFAHFCWHYEDNALYSINAMHAGAPKTWYCVPGSAAGELERVADEIFAKHPDRYHPHMHGACKST